MQTERGAAMINGKAATMELTQQHQTCAETMAETMHSDTAQNDGAANRHTHKTTLQRIIDSPRTLSILHVYLL
jgi:hypothetical protein